MQQTNSSPTFLQKITNTLKSPPKEGIWDDLLLTLFVFIVQIPFFFLYSLFYLESSATWAQTLLTSIGFLILIDLILFLFYWSTRLISKFLKQKTDTNLMFTASISLLMSEIARLFLYVTNKIRRSELPEYFYVNEEPEKRTVLQIFVKSLVLSFLAVLIAFQVRAVTSNNPTEITLFSLDIALFILWSLITTYFFVAWDLLNRADIRYFDKDDAMMRKISSWYTIPISFIIGIVIYWSYTTTHLLLSLKYVILGVMFWSFGFFLISLILINHETEIKKLVQWIREGIPKKNFQLT